MKHIQVLIIHGFASNNRGGNPAGVVLDADGLNNQQKLEVARKVGLSETAFVSASEIADFKLDFFTPTKQIPHCGHATIATFSYLKQTNRIQGNTSSKETIDGIRQIYFEEDKAFMEQEKPKFFSLHPSDRAKTLKALSLKDDDLMHAYEPEIVNTGNSFLMVPVNHKNLLQNMEYDVALVENVSAKYNLIGFYVYAPTDEEGAVATTRMFGPYYGIPEEAATGMAAGPLACYLDKYQAINATTLTISQGRFMHPPSPSKIMVRIEKDENGIQRLFAGGSAYLSRALTVHID